MKIASSTIIDVVVATLVAIGIAAMSVRHLLRERRSEKLRRKFGREEYARAVNESGNRRHAEARLNVRSNRIARTRN
jgi:hypothetical protein